MKLSVLLLGLTFGKVAFSQTELINTFSSEFEFYPGVDGIGHERTESYTFVAFDSVELPEILFENQPVILEKGDTLIISYPQHVPQAFHLNDDELVVDTNAVDNPSVRDRYRVNKYREIIYVTVLGPYAWDGKVIYQVGSDLGGKKFVAQIKPGFDQSGSDGAP